MRFLSTRNRIHILSCDMYCAIAINIMGYKHYLAKFYIVSNFILLYKEVDVKYECLSEKKYKSRKEKHFV